MYIISSLKSEMNDIGPEHWKLNFRVEHGS